MLSPALAFVGLMIVFPLIFTVNLSFTDAFGAVTPTTATSGSRTTPTP